MLQNQGYINYDLNEKKIMVARDVHIDEKASCDWDEVEVSSELVPSLIQEVRGNATPNVMDTTDGPILRIRSLLNVYDICNLTFMKTSCYSEASNFLEWVATMKIGLEMIEKNGTWHLTTLPKDKKAIGVKWVFRTKFNPNGSINKHKVRLVVKGYS